MHIRFQHACSTNANQVCSSSCQTSCQGIGRITHGFSKLPNSFPGFFGDPAAPERALEAVASRNTGCSGQILQQDLFYFLHLLAQALTHIIRRPAANSCLFCKKFFLLENFQRSTSAGLWKDGETCNLKMTIKGKTSFMFLFFITAKLTASV